MREGESEEEGERERERERMRRRRRRRKKKKEGRENKTAHDWGDGHSEENLHINFLP